MQQSRNKALKTSLSQPMSKYIEVQTSPSRKIKQLDALELDLLYKLEN